MIKIGQAAENMSTLRRLALNPVKGEKSLKIGVEAKRKRAGWDWSICERYSDSRNKMRLPCRWRSLSGRNPPRPRGSTDVRHSGHGGAAESAASARVNHLCRPRCSDSMLGGTARDSPLVIARILTCASSAY